MPSDPVLTRERAAIESLERELCVDPMRPAAALSPHCCVSSAALRGMLEQTRQERAGERHAYEEREAQLKKEAEEACTCLAVASDPANCISHMHAPAGFHGAVSRNDCQLQGCCSAAAGAMRLLSAGSAPVRHRARTLQAELHAAKEEGGARERRALERAAAAEAALREAEQQHQDELQRVREAAAHEAESGLAQRLQQAFEEGRQAEAKAGRHRLAERQRKLVLEVCAYGCVSCSQPTVTPVQSQRQLATAVAVQEERVRGLQQQVLALSPGHWASVRILIKPPRQLAAAQEELSRRAQLTSTRDAGGHSTQLDVRVLDAVQCQARNALTMRPRATTCQAFRAEAGGAVAREEALAQEQQRLAALEVEVWRSRAVCSQPCPHRAAVPVLHSCRAGLRRTVSSLSCVCACARRSCCGRCFCPPRRATTLRLCWPRLHCRQGQHQSCQRCRS